MPMIKSFTRAQWDAVARRLDALPVKPAHEHRVSVRDAVRVIQSQIDEARKKGYTIDEIVEAFARDGVGISASTLRYAMQCAAKELDMVKLNTSAGQTGVSSGRDTKRSSRTKSSKSGDTHAGQSRDGGRPVNQPGSMVIRDAFSFEITPDVENL